MNGAEKKKEDTAILMLTLESTRDSKAVPLRHGQILQAVQGKSAHHGTEPGDRLVSQLGWHWVGMNHIASLTEI